MMKPGALEKFKQTISHLADVPEPEWQMLKSHLFHRKFKKNEYLIRADQISEHFYFIAKGLARFFYSTQEGKEFNKHFAMEHHFAGSYHSLILNEPCGFYIQALEPTSTIVMPHDVMRELYDRHPCWERLGRKSIEQMFLFKLSREKELLLDPLETRYQRFIENFPGLPERIPQYHIASYLGVTDVALSRIRKQLNLKK